MAVYLVPLVTFCVEIVGKMPNSNVVQLDIAGTEKDQIEILQSVVVTRKATLTRFVGADSKPQEGLLLKKLDVLVSTCNDFPSLSPIQRASFTNLIHQISSTAEKAKTDLVNALHEISDK